MNGLVVSLDGGLGFRYREDGSLCVVGNNHQYTIALFRDDPNRVGHLVAVLIPFGLPASGHVEALGLNYNEGDLARILVEVAVGEVIDLAVLLACYQLPDDMTTEEVVLNPNGSGN